ncbi:penicillin acylase family protein [Stakelama tenebrarum]|uniref:Penicillin acylase family protein n=1 Tax=Stakelama tenebrarum TaxID=2711215 RepID=A0A6G6Y3E9_9SPHN|nr:penicillin acylase family protein [Sphingosinithalassobacter tenebrarum]QIG79371.1 penicillin acylase family protein [Sphingosinithalassobacter tenebrarum]
MISMKRLGRVALLTGAGLAGIAAAATGGGYLWLRSSLPDYSADRSVAGPRAGIEIIRDAHAVPHIFAKSREDAYFALGYVHAQDRLWQLEMTRLAGQGRITEAVGESGLPTDKLVAALDLDRVAAATHARNSPETRTAIHAYVLGINAGIDTRKGALPPEFVLLGVEPGHWTDADVNRLGGLVALGMGDWREEMLRARLATKLDCERLHDLYARPDERPITYPGLPERSRATTDSCSAIRWQGKAAANVSSLPFGRSHPASNSWTVSGSHTVSGKPMLANDPHGPLGAPADYYPVRMSWPGFEIVGASRPGSPAVASGRNGFIAWGITDMMADQSDIFVERIDPADPGRYLTPEGSAPFRTRTVSIPVKGGEAQAVTLRYTRHGIVLSDIDADAAQLLKEQIGPGYVLAVSGLDNTDGNPLVQAFLGMAEARDWQGFEAAARGFGLQHNLAFAARDGTIGMISAGRLPLRRGDGFLPVPGWERRFDWTGYLPAEQLPAQSDPESGFLANGNNRLVPGSGGALDSTAFVPGWRAGRIEAVLAPAQGIGMDRMTTLQLDTVSLEVAALKPVLRDARPQTEQGRQAQTMLFAWDGEMAADRPEPLIWAAWQRAAGLALLRPKLGGLADAWLKENRPRLDRLLQPGSGWCADCPALAAKALDDAVGDLAESQGSDMTRWRWGDVHRASFRHDILSHVPLIGGLVTIRVPAGGGANTVNAGQTDLWGEDPWADIYGPRYRQVIDLAAPEKSLYMIAPGVSGNPLSHWFGSFAKPWSRGEYVTLTGDPETLRKSAVGDMTLTPAR